MGWGSMSSTSITESYAHIPEELRSRKSWVCWRMEQREGQPKPTKVPYNFHSGRKASSTEPRDWGTFEDAALVLQCLGSSERSERIGMCNVTSDSHGAESSERSERIGTCNGAYDGLGFVFAQDDPYTGIDLDGAYEAPGCLYDWSDAIISSLGGYAERSPSGMGVHIIVRAKLASGGRRRRGAVEVYDRGRYFTMTGERMTGSSHVVPSSQAAVDALVASLGDTPGRAAAPVWQQAGASIGGGNLLERARHGRIRRETLSLLDTRGPDRYGSASEADSALASGLASAGMTADEILCLIEQSTRGMDAYQRKGNSHGLYYFRRTVENAVRFVGPVVVIHGVRYQMGGAR